MIEILSISVSILMLLYETTSFVTVFTWSVAFVSLVTMIVIVIFTNLILSLLTWLISLLTWLITLLSLILLSFTC